MGIGVWAELLSDAQIAEALPALSAAGSRIGLALPAVRLGDPAIAHLTRQARELGVSVRAWLLLSRADGYWIGETNAEQFVSALERLTSWCAEPGGPAFDGVSVDLEPAYEYSEALRTSKKLRPDHWLSLLAAHVDRARFERAQAVLGRGVAQARRHGLYLHAVTYPLVLDQPEGDVTLEDAFDIPVSGIDWDEVSVMVYQTAFAQQLGIWLGPALVHSYAEAAVHRFGERAGIDVGVVGEAGIGLDPGDRYPSPSELDDDLGAALAAGIPASRIRVYGLGGALTAGGALRWLARPLAASAPAPSRAVDGVRNGARAVVTAIHALSR
jgi:hypothetical protein